MVFRYIRSSKTFLLVVLMGSESRLATSVTIFCRVVDFFGDIGVCWRLARQLVEENDDVEVTLVVDDMSTFHKICAAVDRDASMQSVGKVKIISWKFVDHFIFLNLSVDLVIEAFGCTVPEKYLQVLAKLPHPPLWINLEYLSAELWVEKCHCLPSPHSTLPLVKHFFFPGFTTKTGGLLREKNLYQHRLEFQQSLDRKVFLSNRIGEALEYYWEQYKDGILVSLFCYGGAPVEALLGAMSDCEHEEPTICLVPEGVATKAVSDFLQSPAVAGAICVKGNLLLAVVELTDQSGYDELLWACDLNFVRGEDSFLRAQWAARPAVWHIYPQDDDAHIPKLNAFVERYADNVTPVLRAEISGIYNAWNGDGDIGVAWKALGDLASLPDQFFGEEEYPAPNWSTHSRNWASVLGSHPDLASSLLQYVRKVG